MVKRKYKIAIVWWNDASYDDSIMDREKAESMRGCNQITVGHLVDEDDDYIRLAMETSSTFDDWWQHVVCIPKAWIVKRKIIRV